MTTVLDEETPLLSEVQQPNLAKGNKSAHTPLPRAQFSIILFVQLAEPLTSQLIYPFTPELIRSLNIAKNEAEVGYYVGMMQSLFFATQALTVLHWSRLSDHIGRKPVILTGLFGLSLSMYCFGLSTTFWGFVLSRSMNGILNGNIGVLKSMLAEITDKSNLSVAYSYVPIAWNSGAALGPIIGGALSRPAERFPNLFGNSQFLKHYPYFLPCAVPATFSIIAWLVSYRFLKETVKAPISIRHLLGLQKHVENATTDTVVELDDAEQPLPMRKLLIPKVLIASSNYALLALVDISFRALQPLFLSTPVDDGGLGLSPPIIGSVLSYYGIISGVFQVFFFAKLTDRFGARNIFIVGISAAVPCFILFPISNILARRAGGELTVWVWSAVALQVSLSVMISLCYGAIFFFIATSSPNRASLGATNGLAQLLCSIVRAIGPALINSLFSLSMDKTHHYMNGLLVYCVSLSINAVAIGVSMLLPKKVWGDEL